MTSSLPVARIALIVLRGCGNPQLVPTLLRLIGLSLRLIMLRKALTEELGKKQSLIYSDFVCH